MRYSTGSQTTATSSRPATTAGASRAASDQNPLIRHGAAATPTSFAAPEAHRKADLCHEAALDEQEHLERIGDKAADWVGEATCHAAFNAFDALLSAAATTLPGIVAKLAYLQDIAKRDAWMLTDRPDGAILLVKGFAASIANVMAVQS